MIKTKLMARLQDPFISAASGLILVNECFYLVADDENGLFSLPKNLQNGRYIRIFSRDLPEEHKARKKLKPDFEALMHLEKNGTILCIPSGSKPNRMKAALVTLDGVTTAFDVVKSYSLFQENLPELNIEGAITQGEDIYLFQRGNGSLHQNAVIKTNLNDFLSDTVSDFTIHNIQLGKLNNVPLSFTDACLYEDRIYFLAVSERTESTYDDGEFAGAVLGEMNYEFEIQKITELEIDSKPEGIVIQDDVIYLVTDDDDRSVASGIFSARF